MLWSHWPLLSLTFSGNNLGIEFEYNLFPFSTRHCSTSVYYFSLEHSSLRQWAQLVTFVLTSNILLMTNLSPFCITFHYANPAASLLELCHQHAPRIPVSPPPHQYNSLYNFLHWRWLFLLSTCMHGVQWRINDFPKEGAPTPKILLLCIFKIKTAWKWNNLDPQFQADSQLIKSSSALKSITIGSYFVNMAA